MDSLFDQATEFFHGLQDEICGEIERADGEARFAGDGGARFLVEGVLVEKAGVICSQGPETPHEADLRITALSLAVHPLSPMVPTLAASFHHVEQGDEAWFGGGADLAPCYFFQDDAVSFHRALEEVCGRHAPIAEYPRFKSRCDERFRLPRHPGSRGVGGIHFERLGAGDGGLGSAFEFVQDAARAVVPAYLAIAGRRQHDEYSDAERRWQLSCRGRYAETVLGGELFPGSLDDPRIVAMNLPPLVRWDVTTAVEAGSREALLLTMLEPHDWLAMGSSSTS